MNQRNNRLKNRNLDSSNLMRNVKKLRLKTYLICCPKVEKLRLSRPKKNNLKELKKVKVNPTANLQQQQWTKRRKVIKLQNCQQKTMSGIKRLKMRFRKDSDWAKKIEIRLVCNWRSKETDSSGWRNTKMHINTIHKPS